MLQNRFFSILTGAALISAAACGGAEEAPEAETGADAAVIEAPITTAPVADPAAAPLDTAGFGATGATGTTDTTGMGATGTTGTTDTTGTTPATTP